MSSGDDLPIAWKHRDERYGEKLATPDTSVGDLIGDVDPIKVAEGRTLGDPETVHYGLVPRTNRGIFAVNELPDLAERIQVALLNVLEERDIQVRGYLLSLPLDVLLVASANPEDYTNRGRIITPLKDRFGAEIRTHYPLRPSSTSSTWFSRRPALRRGVRADHLIEVIAGSPGWSQSPRSTRAPACPRGSPSPRPRARRRAPCAGCAHRRRTGGGRPGQRPARRRPDAQRQGRVRGVGGGPRGRGADAPAPPAAAETFRRRLGPADLAALIDKFDEGTTVGESASWWRRRTARRVGPVRGWPSCWSGWHGGRGRRRRSRPRRWSRARGPVLNRRISADVQGRASGRRAPPDAERRTPLGKHIRTSRVGAMRRDTGGPPHGDVR